MMTRKAESQPGTNQEKVCCLRFQDDETLPLSAHPLQPPASPLLPASAPSMLPSIVQAHRRTFCVGLCWRTHSEGPCSAAKPDGHVSQALTPCTIHCVGNDTTRSILRWADLQYLCGGLQAADLRRALLLALGLGRLLLRCVRADGRHLPLVLRLQAPPSLHLQRHLSGHLAMPDAL